MLTLSSIGESFGEELALPERGTADPKSPGSWARTVPSSCPQGAQSEVHSQNQPSPDYLHFQIRTWRERCFSVESLSEGGMSCQGIDIFVG